MYSPSRAVPMTESPPTVEGQTDKRRFGNHPSKRVNAGEARKSGDCSLVIFLPFTSRRAIVIQPIDNLITTPSFKAARRLHRARELASSIHTPERELANLQRLCHSHFCYTAVNTRAGCPDSDFSVMCVYPCLTPSLIMTARELREQLLELCIQPLRYLHFSSASGALLA